MGVLLVLSVVFALVVQVSAQDDTDWPSLRFHFTLKRSSMKVHGESEFSMYATPFLSDKKEKVLYDVFASFRDDEMLYNYTLVAGIPYASTLPLHKTNSPSVTCIDSESGTLPAINSIVAAINQATPVTSGGNGSNCVNGKVFKVTIHGIDFALCSSSSGFTMQGTDMDINVGFLEERVDIVHPSDTSCEEEVAYNAVTSIGSSLLTGQPIPEISRNLKAEFDFSFRGKSSCSCKSTPRPCIFVHGLGVKTETSENEDFFSYWGKSIVDHAPCCSSLKFAHLNTVNNTWTSHSLQHKVCERALAVSNTSSKSVITDTIVITHSMGNLMFSGALATEKCSLDASSTWVGMAGPMIGSMASDFVQESCSGETNEFWEEVGDITGRCPPNTGLKSLAYEHGNFSTHRLNNEYAAAQKAYRENVHALMCGRSYSGLVSKYQAKFWALGHSIPHKSKENDGMVEFQSCAHGFSEEKFGDNYRDRFYKTKLNHYDMQFLAGDSLLNEDKMPVKWFECLL
ncbi:hypothetical protein P3T76_015403 [Phytophthora citrophthora]|uniref:Uncharacterized protein n=1 Tax=Phytophthora citrophthora TaxID=4793 RepID=A0AAD9FZV0_9STRA|nr:hypothetical protein P3T76_015403 [Phytophthora citrophthora]